MNRSRGQVDEFYVEDEGSARRNDPATGSAISYIVVSASNTGQCYLDMILPYAILGGIVSFRFSLTHMPLRPSSQPLITWPAPTGVARKWVSVVVNKIWKGTRTFKVERLIPVTAIIVVVIVFGAETKVTAYLESNFFPSASRIPVCQRDKHCHFSHEGSGHT